jgi:hypothetical protein
MLSLLDTSYRRNSTQERALAHTVMIGPVISLAQQ